MLLFVYGTLKRTHGNHRIIEQSKGVFISDALTAPYFNLVSLGGFPGMVAGKHRIRGEFYQVDNLEITDMLEGYPSFYDRDEVIMYSNTQKWLSVGIAWAYLYNIGKDSPRSQGGISFDENTNEKWWG